METENPLCIIRSMDDLFPRPLKQAGSRSIEDAITKAICDLTGEKYEVDIRTIDFGNDSSAWMQDTVTLTVSMQKPFKWPGDEPTVTDETTATSS